MRVRLSKRVLYGVLMRSLLGLVFCALALLSGFYALVSGLFLLVTIAQYERELEDVILNAVHLAISVVLTAFWSAGVVRSLVRKPVTVGKLDFIGIGIALEVGAYLAIVGAFAPFGGVIGVETGLVVLLGTAGYTWLVRREKYAV